MAAHRYELTLFFATRIQKQQPLFEEASDKNSMHQIALFKSNRKVSLHAHSLPLGFFQHNLIKELLSIR